MNVWPIRTATLFALLAAGWVAGSAVRERSSPGWSRDAGKIRVLTTIFPIYDFARTIGGDAVEVRNLLPPGADPHEFALSPRAIQLAARADVILANGAGLDDFVLDAIERAGAVHGQVVRVAPLQPSGGEPGHEHTHEIESEREHSAVDPHQWLDPALAREYAETIMSALSALSRPDDKGGIAARGGELVRDISALDAEFSEKLAPLRGSAFIAFHAAFTQLANRYGLRVAAVWQETPGREPSPHDVAALLNKARSERVRALFAEPQLSTRSLDLIAADARLPVYTLDPLETSGNTSANYVKVMRWNLATLRRALK